MNRYKYISLLLLFTLLSVNLLAQVKKSVEVEKSFVPELSQSHKMSMQPDFTDTVKIRPDIDYTIQPKSLNSDFSADLFRPATVTYWEFNRPKPFYLKAGVGYPFASGVDFYASTQNSSTGYAMLYLNHDGDYSKIENDAKFKANSLSMNNRIGLAAGYYISRHIMEGEVWHDNRLRHRYGASFALDDYMVGSRVNIGQTGLRLRVGDDFLDEGSVNFDAQLYAQHNYDNSKSVYLKDVRQIDAGAAGKVGFRWGSHNFIIGANFDGKWGSADIADYSFANVGASLRYSFTTRRIDAKVGADYNFVKIHSLTDGDKFNYIFPYAKFHLNLGDGAFVPFLELNSTLAATDFFSLSQINPYLATGMSMPKSQVDYNLRIGADGSLSTKFTYRVLINFTWSENALYWFGLNFPNAQVQNHNFLQFGIRQARRDQVSIMGELEWRIVRDLMLELRLEGATYDFDGYMSSYKLGGGLPAFKSGLKLGYDHKRFSVAANAQLHSTRHWSCFDVGTNAAGEYFLRGVYTAKVPVTIDLGLDFNYHINSSLSLFLEGRNLCNQRLYDFANYPLQGVGVMVGVKATF